ncbi:MAG: ADP-forming succinate--CoA ligase subunit beta [Gammaproteobacteria bacterium CG_4_10_14_0_8_um_filter_38_16]|nr:MAG: ADP-forming succinate--CoA ligase subunit beta [Gammaproteobacteria bacterium CG_4_10_14_0_8_um_filter_38_16]PJA02967.1 MAG: ADP-forming succinate--CoA ligase subunit beta [Gammaproteobacteria bacterium CG_4_10_14_0_2_um_filter_38_22]PJB09433.1 MAG: ADP-forming succinate--CoA ligase subunit beta [Gammaproteobacteria bacterium CG_4_9_14_3_um_filter_38_9]
MNLHEYQAKNLLRQYQVAVPDGVVVFNPDEVKEAAMRLGGDRWVVKAQVHAGGRGKAGGVKLVSSIDEATQVAQKLLGTRLVTFQTDEHGQPVNQLWIEKPSDIARELYLGAVVDRTTQSIVFMASTEGGVEIEEVAHNTPEKILKVVVDPIVGMQPFQCRELFFGLGLQPELMRQFTQLVMGLYEAFVDNDMGLLEINPLVITKTNELICLDAKINLDDNAMYRHPALREMRDTTQEEERETRAQKWELNYVALDGDIGCMVNGAGLAMATMDMIKLQGGNPANFLDVGGGATRERVTEAFKIITSDKNVKGILVNIFGGIVRCDMIAEGIIAAVADVGVKVPVVARLEGNNAELGAKKLAESGLNITPAVGFTEAAKKIVALVK